MIVVQLASSRPAMQDTSLMKISSILLANQPEELHSFTGELIFNCTLNATERHESANPWHGCWRMAGCLGAL